MPASNSSGVVSTAVFIDCLKLFQQHPEQFPLDLRAKFCGCSRSGTTSSVCEEYSKQRERSNKVKKQTRPITQPPKIQRQESGEFISTASEPSNNVKQLTNVAEELKDILQQKLKTRSLSNDSQKIPSAISIKSSREENKTKSATISPSTSIQSSTSRDGVGSISDGEVDVLRTIHYLIAHPEKIPVQAVSRLCKIAASLPIHHFKSNKRSRDAGSTTASETLHSGSEVSRMPSDSKTKKGTGNFANIVDKHLLKPPSTSSGGGHSIKKSPSNIKQRTSSNDNHENQKKKQSSQLHKTARSIEKENNVTSASQKRSARSGTNTSTSTAISSTSASPSPTRSFKAQKRKSTKKHSSSHRMHREGDSSLASASTSRSRSKSPHVKNDRMKTIRKKQRSKRMKRIQAKSPGINRIGIDKEGSDASGAHTPSAPIASFSQTKLGTAKQPVPMSPIQTKAQSQLAQPALVREKLTIHQPIPFMIFRLCCPPGMIPLTSKVAERLGINVKMSSQQSQNKIDGTAQ